MLFQWTIPKRRVGHRSLPTIPAEIYLEILEYLAPPGEALSPEQTKTLTRLAGACKLFCHIALPRIYERVSIVGHVHYRHDNLLSSRGASLCGRIASREDLALWAAKCVRECNFRDWLLKSEGSWAVSMFAERYASSLRHMTNIRRLTFFECFITNKHWRAIMALGTLEELVFDRCGFAGTIQVKDGIQAAQPVKLGVPSIEFYEGGAHHRIAAEAFDLGGLRSLKTDIPFAKLLDWPQDCILEQFHLREIDYKDPVHCSALKPILRQTGQSVTELKLSFYDGILLPNFGHYFQDSWPGNIRNLRSLTLVVDAMTRDWVEPCEMSSLVCRCVGFSLTMEKLIVQFHAPYFPAWQPSFNHLYDILPTVSAVFPRINYIEIYGTAIRLDGDSWVEVTAPQETIWFT
ncbi:hypothetical protein EDC04DRAFT_2725756 [Pisolithus marmoratus]|nr:hypothetical protein EDC04DRAFT_2725756 [Pisolithus marmoratus]